jgi:hypothetical protein
MRLSNNRPAGTFGDQSQAVIGAGGFVAQMVLRPGGLRLCRTDVGGAYKWDYTKDKWVQLFKRGAFIAPYNDINFFWEGTGNYWDGAGCFEIDAAETDLNYIVAWFVGYLFLSTDGGTTFSRVTAMARQTARPGGAGGTNRLVGRKMEIDPSDKLTWHVATETQLFRTTDGGNTFTQVTTIPTATGSNHGIIVRIDRTSALVSGRHSIVYAYVSNVGLFKSTDAGATYTQIIAETGFAPRCLKVDQTGKAWQSAEPFTQSGAWSMHTVTSSGTVAAITGLSNADAGMFAIDPTNSSRVIAMNGAGYFQLSTDGGATWSISIGASAWTNQVTGDVPWIVRNSNFQSYLGISGLEWDPDVAGKVWAPNGVGVFNLDAFPSSVSFSTKMPWKVQSRGIEELVADRGVSIPGGPMMLMNQDRAAFACFDFTTLKTRYWDDSFQQTFGWDADYAGDDSTFIGVHVNWGWQGAQSSGYSESNGADGTFVKYPTVPSTGIAGGLAVSTKLNHVIIPGQNMPPVFTLNKGSSWANCNFTPTATAAWSQGLGIDRHVITADKARGAGYFYAFNGAAGTNTAETGVYESIDGGQNFSRVFVGCPTNIAYAAYGAELKCVPGRANTVTFTIGGTGQVNSETTQTDLMISFDACRTWSKILGTLSDGTPITRISEAQISWGPAAPGQSWPSAYVLGWVNGTWTWMRSDDGLATWTILPMPDMMDTFQCIVADRNKYGQVLAGWSGNGWTRHPYRKRLLAA